MKFTFAPSLIFLCCSLGLTAQEGKPGSSTLADGTIAPEPLLKFVNPLIGTGGHGHTFPGACAPFGMVQLSPDTRTEGWDACSGYYYEDKSILGFSHTHLSGTGVGDYMDVQIMPFAGKQNAFKPLSVNKDSEKAYPGYYYIENEDGMWTAELTATPHVGIHRYSIKQKERQYGIAVRLSGRDKILESNLEGSGLSFKGFVKTTGWATNQAIYFVLESNTNIERTEKTANPGEYILWLQDGVPPSKLMLRVALSSVSEEKARVNMKAETGTTIDFDAAMAQTQTSWNKELSKIVVTGGTEDEKTIFYTALYHCMVAPNVWSDVDGEYRGMDGKVHKAEPGKKQYTVFSLWDTYRSLHPLFTIIDKPRTIDFINTFIEQFKQQGRLPIWELAANETNCMIGYHAVSVIADAYIKGIKDFDTKAAFEAMKATANGDVFGLADYKKYGFVPSDVESESVSKTLEYAYDDWCIGQMATYLGYQDDAEVFMKRAQNWKNLYDPSTGFFRPRINGGWAPNFDPAEVNFHFTEANAWQYRFSVPQMIGEWQKYMPRGLGERLDSLFTAPSQTTGREQSDITGLIGQYAHGNEPSHHIAYLYNYAGQPNKSQDMVRQIMSTMYQNSPEGLCGNEDCGQMSAWYVLSAMGIYPVAPGSPKYVVGVPLFDKVVINTGDAFFTIQKESAGDYVAEIIMNGKTLLTNEIEHADMNAGKSLEIMMGGKKVEQASKPEPEPSDKPKGKAEDPNKGLAADVAAHNEASKAQTTKGGGVGDLAPSMDDAALPFFVPAPFINGEKVFAGESSMVVMGCLDAQAEIHYTLDGKEPTINSTLYKNAFSVSKDMVVKAKAFRQKRGTGPTALGNDGESVTVTATFHKLPQDWKVIYTGGKYANQYTAGGNTALINGIRGSKDFRMGAWQGIEGGDLVAIVDFGKPIAIKEVGVGFLQDIKSWIWMPQSLQFETSEDGNNFKLLGMVYPKAGEQQEGSVVEDLSKKVSVTTRYLRVSAKNRGVCPPWHLGAGSKSWIFMDEIWVK